MVSCHALLGMLYPLPLLVILCPATSHEHLHVQWNVLSKLLIIWQEQGMSSHWMARAMQMPDMPGCYQKSSCIINFLSETLLSRLHY